VKARRVALLAAALSALLAACGTPPDDRPPAPPIQTDRYLVGAYYYTWYPRNFGQGYLRGRLSPPQRPALGVYSSADVGTVEKHIAWASRAGVDFFAVSWWPGRPRQNRVIPEVLLRAGNIRDLRFCVFYESADLGYDPERGRNDFDRAKADRFVADLVSIAESYFRHPSYLAVGGRPVVFLYLTRTLTGELEAAVGRARRELLARGFDPFFVADEVFWDVSRFGGGRLARSWTPTPQVPRIRLFDAITGYNLYENSRKGQQGYPARSSFVPDAVELFERYRSAAGPGGYFVPGVIPGFNDRGVRSAADHYVIPRQWEAGAPEGSTLGGLFDRLALPFVDPRLNMIMISTWNEWNEDTAIEPVETAAATSRDTSASGSAYTQGYAYAGYGTAGLEVVRDKVVAVAGRLTDASGAPRWGAAVAADRDGVEVARGASDRDGYYRLSRLRMPPGSYRVAVVDGAASRRVEVRAGATTTGVDFGAAEGAAPPR
jgi:glycoprotein endo-alpha-1,2-mannosidase